MHDPQRTNDRTAEELMKQLSEVLGEMPSMMLTTSPNGTLAGAKARPMWVAKRGESCTLYFLTSALTSQAQDLRKDELGMCTGQSKTLSVTLLGIFNLVSDRLLIEELWSKRAEGWFRGGIDDPNIRVIVFRPTTAELWDLSGGGRVGYFIDIAKFWLNALRTHAPSASNPKAMSGTYAKVNVTPV